MNLTLFSILLLGLIISSIFISKRKSQAANSEDFFLMGRSLGGIGLVMTLLATQIGGGALLGSAEEAYQHGWLVLCYPLGMAIGMAILGLGYGGRLQSLRLTTIAEIFERKYHSSRLRKVAASLSIFALFLILSAQAIAARKFLVSIGFSSDLWFITTWLALVCYTVMGGLRAVVKTDILQACFIIVVFALALLGLKIKGHAPNPISSFSTESTPWVTWLCMPLFFMLIEQDMAQRCSAAGSAKTVSRSALITSVLLLVISLVPIFLGVTSSRLGIEMPQGGSVLIESVKQLTSPTIATAVIVGILMAIVSTADSLLCAISSNIACDFKLDSSLNRCRLITAIVGLGALAFSFGFSSVIGLLMFAYELSVALLFVPVVMALFLKQPSKQAAIVSMLIGGLSFPLYRTHTISFLFPLIYALGGYLIVTYQQKKGSHATTEPPHR